jgi:hypothetical protein
MWHTEYGDRVLEGAEAKVFAESLLDLIQCDLVEEGGFQAGIPVFDSLSSPQKIAVLHQVANALFRTTIPMPELTAVLEGAVGAVIQNLRWLVEEELAPPSAEDMSFRSLISRACRDLGVEEVPAPSCDDPDQWAFCVECLHDAILWDSDYLEDGNFMDLPPEYAKALKENMGISEEYFRSVAPDPPPRQGASLRSDLETLCCEVAELGHPRKNICL